jgi:hypothetical protein
LLTPDYDLQVEQTTVLCRLKKGYMKGDFSYHDRIPITGNFDNAQQLKQIFRLSMIHHN